MHSLTRRAKQWLLRGLSPHAVALRTMVLRTNRRWASALRLLSPPPSSSPAPASTCLARTRQHPRGPPFPLRPLTQNGATAEGPCPPPARPAPAGPRPAPPSRPGWPGPAAASPAERPGPAAAAPTCFALSEPGGAGGLFRPRPRVVAVAAGGKGPGRRSLYGRAWLTWAAARSAFFGQRRAGAAPGPTPKYGDGRGRIPGGRPPP